MKRRKMIAGNWKMNKKAGDASPFFGELNDMVIGGLALAGKSLDVLVAAPLTALPAAIRATTGLGVHVAAQNCHWEQSGAYTGEVSGEMLSDIGVDWTLVGHSERRQYFGETDESVEKRVRGALAAGLRVIACIGETLDQRRSGATEAVVSRQLRAVLAGAGASIDRLVIAYEPVWAIGTGVAATPDEAQAVHRFLRDELQRELDKAAGLSMRLLYGGSMSPANVGDLLIKEDIDGGLIGGASLKPQDFAAMINAALRIG